MRKSCEKKGSFRIHATPIVVVSVLCMVDVRGSSFEFLQSIPTYLCSRFDVFSTLFVFQS